MQINLKTCCIPYFARYISSVDRRSHTVYIPTKNGITLDCIQSIVNCLYHLGIVQIFENMDVVRYSNCVVSCIGIKYMHTGTVWIDRVMLDIERIIGYRGVRVRNDAMEDREVGFTAFTFASLNTTSNANSITNNFIAQHAPHFVTPNKFPLDPPTTQEPVLEKAKCECGAHATFGNNCHSSSHSRWCPLYKE